MDTCQIATLLAFLFPLSYSPGPGNMFFATNGARFGIRATLEATTGYRLATFAVTLLIGFGFSSTYTALPQAFTVIKVGGALYVLWLAWKLCRTGGFNQQEAKPEYFHLLLILGYVVGKCI